MKKLLIVLLFLVTGLNGWEIEKPYLRTSKELDGLELFHENGRFIVLDGKNTVMVQSCFVDKELRGLSDVSLSFLLGVNRIIEVDGKSFLVRRLSLEHLLSRDINKESIVIINEQETKEIEKALAPSGCIEVKKTDEGQYLVKFHGFLNGGGGGGAVLGAWIGKIAVYTVGHGFIAGTSLAVGLSTMNPAAAAMTFTQLEASLGAEIEAASQVGAMAGGILCGVASGPA